MSSARATPKPTGRKVTGKVGSDGLTRAQRRYRMYYFQSPFLYLQLILWLLGIPNSEKLPESGNRNEDVNGIFYNSMQW